MADEFASFLSEARKSPIEEKVNAFGDIVEKIMSIVLRIPDLVDNTLAGINTKISSLESRIGTIQNDVAAIKARGTGPAPAGGAPGGPPGAPPPPGGPPGAPPPPGGPPGAPPPPGGPPGGPPPGPGGPGGGPKPSPVSLRGAIMGELKSLFAKRKQNQ